MPNSDILVQAPAEAANNEPASAPSAESAAAAELSAGLAARVAALEAELHLARAAAAEAERRAAAETLDSTSGSANGAVGAGAARAAVLRDALGRAHRLARPPDAQQMSFGLIWKAWTAWNAVPCVMMPSK